MCKTFFNNLLNIFNHYKKNDIILLLKLYKGELYDSKHEKYVGGC